MIRAIAYSEEMGRFREKQLAEWIQRFNLKDKKILEIGGGQGEYLELLLKAGSKYVYGIENSKEIPFERVLFGLGIRYVGETVAKKLAKQFKNIDAIACARYDDLIQTEEIGEKIAISVQQFFLEESNLKIIDRLKEKGLQFQIREKEKLSAKLEGKTVVVSGTFETFSRDELKELIDRNGGKNGASVSGNTDYLVAGANMGPAKLKKATDLGVKIISEDEFIKLISS